MPDFSKFKGALPYASELLGVYQPILGWESRMVKVRAAREVAARTSALMRELMRDSRMSPFTDGRLWVLDAPTLPALAGGPSNRLTSLVAERATALRGPAGGLTPPQWESLLSPEALQALLRQSIAELDAAGGGDPAAGGPSTAFDRESLARTHTAAASLLGYWATAAPETLNSLFFSQSAAWQRALGFVDPLAVFPKQARQAVLSPVGLLTLYRQYFFEFDRFLGPPVGHVWISPGGSVELMEVNVRKTTVERTTEIATEITTKSEQDTTRQDELSDAVKQDNADNIRFGAKASGGFNVIVAHGEASASFDLDTSRKTASEQTHKQTRQQSEKLSSEIRRNFKTTFRTVTEKTDTSSRRYVLQNNTDKLQNYELCRKMRQVGVQLQHIGTQLCWQFYVDDPGQFLATSRLVSVAQPADLDVGPPPPDAPDYPKPQEIDFNIDLPYIDLGKADDDRGKRYDFGSCKNDGGDGTIQHELNYQYAPPAGMQLSQVLLEGPPRKFNPNHDLPDPFQVRFEVDKTPQGLVLGRFKATMEHVNFKEQDRIPITLKLVFTASVDTLSKKDVQYGAQLAEYTAAKSRAQHEAYVKAVRERIKAAGEVKTRAFDDLREEERHVVYRRLLDALTTGAQASTPDQVHLTSELLRRLFDVDAVLYFIAPDWWRPRTLHYYTETPPGGAGSSNDPFQLQESEKVGWEPVNANRPPNYLVTEESQPAPLGASLGWQLELDGDNLRNAFLNAAWVKAVLPIRFGRERDALQWLKDHVEGMDGLDAVYQDGPAEWNGKTIGEVLDLLAEQIDSLHDQGNQVDSSKGAQPAETVFQNGFDPLQGGVRVNAKSFEIFDQWLEVLPTDQVVAQEYHG